MMCLRNRSVGTPDMAGGDLLERSDDAPTMRMRTRHMPSEAAAVAPGGDWREDVCADTQPDADTADTAAFTRGGSSSSRAQLPL